MLDWLRRRATPKPLTGAPARPRQKTYSAETGHAYQYQFAGQREANEPERGVEYVFVVTAQTGVDQLALVLPTGILTAWESAAARALTGPERYAVAKLTLLALFDQQPPPLPPRLVISAADLDRVAALLEW